MKIRPGIELANLTDIGCARENNEDYYGYAEPESDSEFALRGRLVIIADGMGGHAAGEVASQLVIAALAHLDDDEPGGDLLAKLDAAGVRYRAVDIPDTPIRQINVRDPNGVNIELNYRGPAMAQPATPKTASAEA